MNQESRTPMKSKTSFFAVMPLAVLAAVVYAAACRPAPTDSYESFTLALDRLSGPGQWSARSHKVSSAGLTVQGLNIKLPPDPGGQTDGQPGVLTLEEIFIKKLPSRSQMEKLLSLTNWQGQPGTVLAEALRLKGFRHQGTWIDGEFEGRIEELNAEAIKLAQAGPGAPAGKAGFLKALRLEALSYKNLHLAFKAPEAEAAAAVASATVQGLHLGGDVPLELAKILDANLEPDQTGLLKVLGGLGFKSLKAAGLKLDFTGRAPEAPLQGHLSLAALEETDVQSLKSLGSLKLTNLQSRFTDGEGQVSSLNLAEFSLRGLEAADYMTKLMAGLAAMSENPESDEAFGQFTLADLFVSPIALDEVALKGLNLDMAGLAAFKLAELRTTGPYRIGEIPASAKTLMKGLEINLPGEPQAEPGTPGRDIYELSQKLGRNAFVLETEAEAVYEAKTGLWTTRISRLAARDLFDLSLSLTWGGLTRDRLERFKQIPLNALFLAALNPEDLLGEASFNAFNIKYTDQGLVDFIFNLKAAEEGGRLTGAELKERTIAQAGLMLMIGGAQYLQNVEALSQPLMNFFKAPGSLEIDLKSTPPLTFKTVASLGGEPSAVLDSLNITISANGEAGSPLRFTPGLKPN